METVIYWLGALTLIIGIPYLTMRMADWLDNPKLDDSEEEDCE